MVTPTCLLRYADAGDVYATWRWTDALHERHAAVIPGAGAEDVLAALDAALPDASGPAAALTTGALADYGTELALARRLTGLIPPALARTLDELHGRGVRPRLRIQPSPRLARVPWEYLAADPEDVRLGEIADVAVLAPTALVHDLARTPRRWATDAHLPVVAVVDPRVPGFPADSRLGSVLGRVAADSAVARHLAAYGERLRPAATDPAALFRRTDVDRDWLSAVLTAGASRLLYVGHATAADPDGGESDHAQLHLACTADRPGSAAAVRGHRPLAARDLILDRFPAPSRVALIACESGGDLRFAETLGLAGAMVHGGAELVTVTRWTLATDLAVERVGANPPAPYSLRDAVIAVDRAHEAPDATTAMADWHRERIAAWREHKTLDHSPVRWAAFTTIDTASAVPEAG